MAELTKLDSRQPMGKIKPTDKMVMMPSLFDSTKEEGEIPQPFKGTKPKQTRSRVKPKGKPQEQRQNPPKAQEADETYTYENPNNYYHNAPSQSRGRRPYNGQSGN